MMIRLKYFYYYYFILLWGYYLLYTYTDGIRHRRYEVLGMLVVLVAAGIFIYFSSGFFFYRNLLVEYFFLVKFQKPLDYNFTYNVPSV